MSKDGTNFTGRAAGFNPANQFEELDYEPDPSEQDDQIETRYFADNPQSILAENNSPDVPFNYSINPYRGCEHGCIYCYARPTHEYLGFSAGTDFESRIVVKQNAPEKLRERFAKPSWTPQTVAFSGNTDPYQPAEEEFELTRKCLKVFLECRNPVSLITKNYRITKDLDLLRELAQRNLVSVRVSITSLQKELIRRMEPRTSIPERRLQAIEELSEAGVPVGVNAAPMIPGLTDEELPNILESAQKRGAQFGAYILVRLPGPVKELFQEWVEREFPDRARKIMNQIRDTRQGDLNQSEFGKRMKGEGEIADFLQQLFRTQCRKLDLNEGSPELNTSDFERPKGDQTELFQ